MKVFIRFIFSVGSVRFLGGFFRGVLGILGIVRRLGIWSLVTL